MMRAVESSEGNAPDGHRDRPWVLALLLVGAVFGETVSSANTPLIVYLLRPYVLLFFVVAYGCPVLLLRELVVRGRLGLLGCIVYGVAYTAFNEGVIADTWYRAGQFGWTAFRLGRFGGVNWTWATGISVYHLLFSLAAPVLLVQIWRREYPSRPWLGRRGLLLTVAPPALLTLLIMLPRDAPMPDRNPRTVAALIAILGPIIALALPPRWPVRTGRPVRAARAYGTGLVWAVAFYGSLFLVPVFLGVGATVVELAAGGIALRYLATRPHPPAWTAMHAIALVAGALTPTLLGSATRIPTLQFIVPVLTALGLWRLRAQVTERVVVGGAGTR